MASDKTERLLNEIGQLLIEGTTDSTRKILLHAELDRNMVAPAIFEDAENRIVYRDADSRLDYALLELWEAQDSTKRWVEIEYLLHGENFEASFTYAEEVDPEEDPLERRDRVVARYLGKKPIDYPPPTADEPVFKL